MKIKKLLIGIISALTLSAAVPVFAAETAPVEAEPIVQDVPVFAQAGKGDSVLTFSLPAGAYKAHFIHDGKHNFIVKCHKGDDTDLLVNKIGTYDGYTALFSGKVDAYDNAILEVKADGNWIIVIEQIVAPSTSSFFGIGDKVTGIIQGNGTNNTVTLINTNSKSNFIVKAYALDYSDRELLANEIGNYTGQVVFKMENKPYYLEVISDGAWAIDFGRGEATTVVGNTTIESSETPAPADETVNATVPAPGNKYTLNTSTKKIHHNSCRYAKKIAPENYATTGSELNELKAHGYTTCGVCF